MSHNDPAPPGTNPQRRIGRKKIVVKIASYA